MQTLTPVSYEYLVKNEDVAAFHGEVIHEVLSTFVLTREAEWVGRLVLLQVKKEDEQGIGSFVEITHKGPAFPGETVEFIGTPHDWAAGEEMVVEITAKVGERLVATGRTGQRLMPKTKLAHIMEKARQGN